MEIKQHIERLQKAIHEQHGCESTHVESVRLQKTYRGQTAWSGTVEVFDLINHAQASRCYAWAQPKGEEDPEERVVAMLHTPPIDSPSAAVQAAIVSDSKRLHFVNSTWTQDQLDHKTVEFRCHSLDYGDIEGTGEFVVYESPGGKIAVCIDVNQQGRTSAERVVTRFYLPKQAVNAIKQNPSGSKFAYSCNELS